MSGAEGGAPLFITVHDANAPKRKYPSGKPVRVRADSIDTLRPYGGGRVRTVLGIRGSFLHVTETEDAILYSLGTRVTPPGSGDPA